MKRLATQARWALSITLVITSVGFLDTHLLVPIIALYAAELGASLGTIGLVIGLYSLTNTPANIFFGRLIDKIGYKIPLLFGLIGDALSMFLYSVTRLPIHLALVRILHGTTGAFVGPATMAAIADFSGGGEKARTMGFYGMSIAVATLVGYGLSGFLASRLGYKAVFFFGVGMLVLGILLSLILPGGRLSVIDRKTPQSGLDKAKDLLKRRGLAVAYSAIFAQYFSFGGVVTLLPLYVKSLGMEAFHVGMLMAVFALVFIICQFPSGLFSDRVGRRLPTVSGLSLGIVSLVTLPSVEIFPLLAVAMTLYGAAYGLLFPSISALVIDHTATEERGMASGIFHALLTSGVALGAPIMGWAGGMLGVKLGLALSSGIMVLALVLTLRVRKHI